jgi:serine/threonine protein phosphatase PrpC
MPSDPSYLHGRALIDAALEHGGPDNVSVVLLER